MGTPFVFRCLSPAVVQQGVQQQLALEPLSLAPLPAYAACGRTCFTASALQTYLHCQRQYYYQQVLAVPELEQTVAGEQVHELPASVTGSIVHKALELYNGYNAEAVLPLHWMNLLPALRQHRPRVCLMLISAAICINHCPKAEA